MIPVWWSIALAAIGIAGLWLAGKGLWQGWAVGIAAQLLWIAYAIATAQPGFIVSALAYGAVNTLNLVRWRRQRSARRSSFDPLPRRP